MALTLHTISSVKTGSTVINQILSSGFSPNLAKLLLTGSGLVSPGFVGIPGASPEISFSTNAIKAALNAFVTSADPMDGVAIAASNFEFYLQKIANTGTRATGSNHIKATALAGLVYPVSLEIPHMGAATLNYRGVFTSSDGSTSPIAFAGSQALDAGVLVAAEAYVLGGISLNGTTLDGVSNVSVDFGNQVIVDGGSGLPYPTHVAIIAQRPSISISTKDLDDFVSWGLLGQAQSETDSIITLTALENAGTLDGANQITLSIDAGLMTYDGFSGSDGDRVAASVTITPTFDGSNKVIAFGGLS